jgi:hypothetical protein
MRDRRGYLPATEATYSATASASAPVTMLAGIAPDPAPPFSIALWTRAASGARSSRFGPTLPCVPLRARVPERVAGAARLGEDLLALRRRGLAASASGPGAVRLLALRLLLAAAAAAGLSGGVGGAGLACGGRRLLVVVDHERGDAEPEDDEHAEEREHSGGHAAQQQASGHDGQADQQ